MADNKFPIFRVPFLALCIILNFYKPHDIIQLSLCSKRSLRVAKQCWKKKGKIEAYLYAKHVPNVDLCFYDGTDYEYRFSISEIKDLHKNQQTHNIRVGDAVVPSIHKKTKTVTFWEDKIFGIGQIVGYIKYLFDVPIHWIEFEAEEHPNEFIRVIDSIKSVQESVETCLLRGENSIDDCLTHLLDNCTITGKLGVFGKLSTQFRHDWNINSDNVLISKGLCITSQNLMNMNCQYLELGSSSLTSEDANQFIKRWQNGNSRVSYASIAMNSTDQETITSGIDTVSQPDGLFRTYKVPNRFGGFRLDNSRIIRLGGLDIRRNDGTTGTIFIYDDKFEFVVDPEIFDQADGR